MKREASITPVVEKIIKEKKMSGLFEVKQTKTDRFSLNNFEDHQLDSLLAAERNGLVWKISDADPRLKPCDIIAFNLCLATVVIKIKRVVYFLEARTVYNLKQGGVKSLSSSDCMAYSYYFVTL